MALVVASFAMASAAALFGLRETHEALHGVAHHEQNIREAMNLSTAVRDAYAHQAHTVILGNVTHLHLYKQARARVQDLLRQREGAQGHSPNEARLLSGMRSRFALLDAEFMEHVVPAIERGDVAAARDRHDILLDHVAAIQRDADALAEWHRQSISGFEAHATVVQHATFTWALAFMLAATFLALGVSFYLGPLVTRPLRALDGFVKKLGAGDLDARLELHRSDEFGQLAAQVNRMAAALKDQRDRLVHSETLAGIGRLAAGVAHEINNPIGVILGYVKLLQRRTTEAEQADLGVIEAEALRCRDIVQGLLDLSRPQRAGAERVDLRALCDHAWKRLEESGAVTKVQFKLEGSATAEGDPERLLQLASNLLRNAAEAAGSGGVVRALLTEDAAGPTLRIQDTGPGLAEDAIAHLYEPFFTTKPQGTGLGLPLSRAIAQAHLGDLSAQNLAGGGAEFTLRLPRQP